MIKFFRKIRQKLLSENKFIRYLIYAIGEIVLVVIGILIALQVNNQNELSKQNRQRITYEQSLITELKVDLYALNMQDSVSNAQLESIENYISYFQSPNKELDVVIRKMDSIRFSSTVFYSTAFTLDEIISTGNLSLFSQDKKEAILRLKSQYKYIEKYKEEVDQKRLLSNLVFENAVDMFSMYQIPAPDTEYSTSWKQNLAGEQYRLFNNKLLAERDVYKYNKWASDQIRYDTEALLNLLMDQ